MGMMTSDRFRMGTKVITKCCAHRGASGHAPENTMAALERAIAMGTQMAEIDVQQTADDCLAVFHDTNLDRTSNGTGPLWRRTMAELHRLDAGFWFGPEFAGERIVTLGEVLDFARGRLILNIEMKMHGHERDVVDLVIGAIHDNNSADHCLVTSFDHEAAAAVKERSPGLRTGLILGPGPMPAEVFASTADLLSVEKSLATGAFFARACDADKAVHVWTVDDPARMSELAGAGAEAIITNFPDRFPRSA
jgi:glycerophosphoryl diester phosphodiesterase